jgi:hypothetical protein
VERGKAALRQSAGCLWILVGVALVATGLRINWERLPVDEFGLTLNDQVGYISVARHWLDNGKLDSSIVYPSLLRQTVRRNSLYMPGFYAELALVYRELGYSAGTSRIPALMSFILALGLVYGIAWRLYGTEVAVFATMLYTSFPINLIYAFTAMAEIPLQAVGLVAFAIFALASQRTRWWLGPLALALPILFRETAVVLGLVMAATLYFQTAERRVFRALVCCGLSAIVFLMLLVSPAGAGRPSMWKANILANGSFDALYSDAFAVEALPASAGAWMHAVVRKSLSNLHSLFSFKGFVGGWLERTTMLFMLSGVPLGLRMWRREKDGFAIGVAVAVSLLLLADLCLYTVWDYRGIRVVLLMQPFVAVLWGISIAAWSLQRKHSLHRIILTVTILLGVLAAIYTLRTQAVMDRWGQDNAAFIESVVGDDRRMIVSPFSLSLDYVNDHYPQAWAFLPENCPTMQLLAANYSIGTVIMPAQTGMPELKLCRTDLQFAEGRMWRGIFYWVYRRVVP